MTTQEVEIKEIKEIDEETLKRLAAEVIKNPDRYPSEARLILTLREWSRQGPSYDDYQRYNVLYGEVKEVVLDEWDEGYPYRRGRDVVIIPLAIPTIVEVERYADTTSPVQRAKTIYVFTGEGWKSVRVY